MDRRARLARPREPKTFWQDVHLGGGSGSRETANRNERLRTRRESASRWLWIFPAGERNDGGGILYVQDRINRRAELSGHELHGGFSGMHASGTPELMLAKFFCAEPLRLVRFSFVWRR